MKKSLTNGNVCGIIYIVRCGKHRFHPRGSPDGEMSEWFKEPVLKTGDRASDRGFESHSLRHFNLTVLDRNVPWSSTQVGDEAPLLRA